MKWPFNDPPNVAVFTNRRILDGKNWIQYVCHDEDDGAWQFHPAGGTKNEETSIVSLKTMVELDPSLISISELPVGWIAWRDSKTGGWQRKINDNR